MPSIHFEDFGTSLSRIPQLIQSIPDIIRNPAANPLQAALLLGIVLVFALVVLLSVLIAIMNPTREEERLLAEEQAVSEEEVTRVTAEQAAQRQLGRLTVTSVIVLVLLAVWVTAGITSSNRTVCASCHPNTSHVAAKSEDPHAKVSCVDCHEGGGFSARVTVNIFARVQHVAFARMRATTAKSFGRPISSDRCAWCHRQDIGSTYVDNELKVRVSHEEPLAAGAQCIDCHALRNGTVTAATVGMSPCLRCHDGKKAKADCSVCHIGDPSRAIRPSVAINAMASAQVPNPQCDGCHKDMTKCNACHGIAMPHSDGFKLYFHARDAAIDIWENDLKTCRKCHYTGHNDCQQCHVGTFPGHPEPRWKAVHGITSWSSSSLRCACHEWNPYDHNGMIFCEICHAEKPAGARP